MKADPKPKIEKSSLADPQVRSAFDHFYALEYDRSISEFEKIAQASPTDPFAVNHLLQAVLFKELYCMNLLDTTLYAHDGFLNGRSVTPDPKVRERVRQLAELAIHLSEERLRTDSDDIDALYARGVARGLRSTYIALVDRSYFAALRSAAGAHNDHQRVIQLDSTYTDAKTVIGTHNYVVGSLPFPVKMLAGIAGLSGNRKKGLLYLAEAAKSGKESRVDAQVALALFLRREGRYADALQIAQTLHAEHPRNFLFALEVSNLLKDAGQGADAIESYSKLVEEVKAGAYPEAHVELAAFGLAESLRGQKNYTGALNAYELAGSVVKAQPELRQRAALGAGQMNDLLMKRAEALKHYESVIEADTSSSQAELARRFLREPYRVP